MSRVRKEQVVVGSFKFIISPLGRVLRLQGETGASHEPLGQTRVERKVE